MYGCAIGMSVAAAFEIVYWIAMKPLVKLMANSEMQDPRLKYLIPTYIILLTVFALLCNYYIISY